MFKTITVFRITDDATRKQLSPDSLQSAIPDATAADPGKTQWESFGFAHPEHFGAYPTFVSADETRVFVVQVRDRVLPGKVIRRHVEERIADLERRQGYKAGRKERAQIKDDTVASLLPTAFVKPTDIPCMVVKDYLIIGTGSARLVDLCLQTIDTAFEQGINVRHIAHGRDPRNWMLYLLTSGSTGGGYFNLGASAVLRAVDSKATMRFKDVDLTIESVNDAIDSGFRPIEITTVYDDRMSFSLSDQMVIKRIAFSDVMLKELDESAEDAMAHFEGTVAMVSGELRRVLDRLLVEIPEQAAVGEKRKQAAVGEKRKQAEKAVEEEEL